MWKKKTQTLTNSKSQPELPALWLDLNNVIPITSKNCTYMKRDRRNHFMKHMETIIVTENTLKSRQRTPKLRLRLLKSVRLLLLTLFKTSNSASFTTKQLGNPGLHRLDVDFRAHQCRTQKYE